MKFPPLYVVAGGVVALAAAVVWWKRDGIIAAVNPFDERNVVNEAVTDAYQWATGSTGTIGTDLYDVTHDDSWSIGTAIYDWTH